MVESSASNSESVLHKAMKKWVAIENYEQGVPINTFEFEKKIQFQDEMGRKYKHTIADVFINHNNCKAYYCECKLEYQWLYKFIEEQVPALKKYVKDIYVVIPENQEVIDPMKYRQFITELNHVGVDILSAPFHIDIDRKERVQIELTYNALYVLVKIKNRFKSNKYLCDFIESDLEKIIKNREGFPYS
jgi:hypothetical protein